MNQFKFNNIKSEMSDRSGTVTRVTPAAPAHATDERGVHAPTRRP